MSSPRKLVPALSTSSHHPPRDAEKASPSTSDQRTPILGRLPSWLTRWVGYRTTLPRPEPLHITCVWSFIGAFCGLAVIQAVFGYANYFVRRGVPPIIPSYGASAVLCYGAISVPLAQPRALIGGHFISALVGIVVSRIFDSPHHPETHWAAGSLATALAIVAMQLTDTTHPPAGATALIVVVDEQANALGWYLLPVVLLSSSLVLATACLINNVQRRYPTFWISPRAAVAESAGVAGGAAVVVKTDIIDEERERKRGSDDASHSSTSTKT